MQKFITKDCNQIFYSFFVILYFLSLSGSAVANSENYYLFTLNDSESVKLFMVDLKNELMQNNPEFHYEYLNKNQARENFVEHFVKLNKHIDPKSYKITKCTESIEKGDKLIYIDLYKDNDGEDIFEIDLIQKRQKSFDPETTESEREKTVIDYKIIMKLKFSNGAPTAEIASYLSKDKCDSTREIQFYETQSADGRFIDKGNGTIYDTQTGLLWMERDTGFSTFNDVNSFLSNQQFVNPSGWRLPSSIEIFHLQSEDYETWTKSCCPSRIYLNPFFKINLPYLLFYNTEDDLMGLFNLEFPMNKNKPASQLMHTIKKSGNKYINHLISVLLVNDNFANK